MRRLRDRVLSHKWKVVLVFLAIFARARVIDVVLAFLNERGIGFVDVRVYKEVHVKLLIGIGRK